MNGRQKGGQLATTTLLPTTSGWLVNLLFPWRASPIGLVVLLIMFLFPFSKFFILYIFTNDINLTYSEFSKDGITISAYSFIYTYLAYFFYVKDTSALSIILSTLSLFLSVILLVAAFMGVSLYIIIPIYILIFGMVIAIPLYEKGYFK